MRGKPVGVPCSLPATALAVLGIAALAPATAAAGVAAAGDFDGDGFADLAIGVPREDIGEVKDAGAVNVLYGDDGIPKRAKRGVLGGLTAEGDQFWHQKVPGVIDDAEGGDRFGSALASGNFDGDCCMDLAVGIPAEDLGKDNKAGAVAVLYGSPEGLAAGGDQLWQQDSDGIADKAQDNDQFGLALAAGNFNDDGSDDLVVGVPREDAGAKDAGIAHAIYGTGAGLAPSGDQLLAQSASASAAADGGSLAGKGALGARGVATSGPEQGDRFGAALVALRFTGPDDLVVGVPGEDVTTTVSVDGAGAINRFGGAATPPVLTLEAEGFQGAGFMDVPEAGDQFGAALGAGNFDDSSGDDYAVGVPGEDFTGLVKRGGGTVEADAGAVHTVSGAAGFPEQFWTQDTASVQEIAEAGDRFGAVLTTAGADFDDDGYDDLAIGVPGESRLAVSRRGPSTVPEAGGAHVLHGGEDGMDAGVDAFFDLAECCEAPAAGDGFGAALAWGDFSGDGVDDLAAGVPFNDVAPAPKRGTAGANAGALGAFYGDLVDKRARRGGAEDTQYLHQDTPGVRDKVETGDRFSSALAGG